MEIVIKLSKPISRKKENEIKRRVQDIAVNFLISDVYIEKLKTILITDSVETPDKFLSETYQVRTKSILSGPSTGFICHLDSNSAVIVVFLNRMQYFDSFERRFIHELQHLITHCKMDSMNLDYYKNFNVRILDEYYSHLKSYEHGINEIGLSLILEECNFNLNNFVEIVACEKNIKNTRAEVLYPLSRLMSAISLFGKDKKMMKLLRRDLATKLDKVLLKKIFILSYRLGEIDIQNSNEIELNDILKKIDDLFLD